MNTKEYSNLIGINENDVRALSDIISATCEAHLRKAEFDWKKTDASTLMILDEARVTVAKAADSHPSLIPGHDKVSLFDPKIDNFIAIVCDIRKSTERLKTLRGELKGIESGIQRVFYETSALLPSLEVTINFFEGKVTEYLGDGLLGFIQYKDAQNIYGAFRASKACVTLTRDIVNYKLWDKYNLPPLDLGVGLALSPAMIRVVTENHVKAFGECVWKATKLSDGVNIVQIDDKLKEEWPVAKTGGISFIKRTTKSGYAGYKAFPQTKKK
ncbi:hypothetical protein [Acinetobacter haemolyticus]|uniref:hypothetical protein n=1 Tax=Acinetobacter haemolyticus TaxID=29430 RepID=UPI0021CD5E0A|nr:hypothetical protein [Acinetobacter haemolyticus]MCU4379630.1 hypothetical protein [Acinetobacter haemolyticus]